MTVPKFHLITLELSPYDKYRPVAIFWLCPQVVTISDNYCNRSLLLIAQTVIYFYRAPWILQNTKLFGTEFKLVFVISCKLRDL